MLTITKENWNKTVREATSPVLVEFTAPWCRYCRRLQPAMERVAEQYADQIQVGQVQVDDQPELAARYGVETIPALLVFRQGEHRDMRIAPGSQAELEEWLRGQLAGE